MKVIRVTCLSFIIVSQFFVTYGKDDDFLKVAKIVSFMAPMMGLGNSRDFLKMMTMIDDLGINSFKLTKTITNMYNDLPNMGNDIIKQFWSAIPQFLNMTAIQGNCDFILSSIQHYNGGTLCGDAPGSLRPLTDCGPEQLPQSLCVGQSQLNMNSLQRCGQTAWESTVKYIQSNFMKCIHRASEVLLHSKWAPKD